MRISSFAWRGGGSLKKIAQFLSLWYFFAAQACAQETSWSFCCLSENISNGWASPLISSCPRSVLSVPELRTDVVPKRIHRYVTCTDSLDLTNCKFVFKRVHLLNSKEISWHLSFNELWDVFWDVLRIKKPLAGYVPKRVLFWSEMNVITWPLSQHITRYGLSGLCASE